MIRKLIAWWRKGLRYECMACGWRGVDFQAHVATVHRLHPPGSPIWYRQVLRRRYA